MVWQPQLEWHLRQGKIGSSKSANSFQSCEAKVTFGLEKGQKCSAFVIFSQTSKPVLLYSKASRARQQRSTLNESHERNHKWSCRYRAIEHWLLCLKLVQKQSFLNKLIQSFQAIMRNISESIFQGLKKLDKSFQINKQSCITQKIHKGVCFSVSHFTQPGYAKAALWKVILYLKINM